MKIKPFFAMLISIICVRNAYPNEDKLLHQAAGDGDIEAVQKIIESKGDLNEKGYVGDTALMRAARNGRLEVLEALLKAGVNIDLTNNFGDTALIIAARTLTKKDTGSTVLYRLLESRANRNIANKKRENFYTFLKDKKVKLILMKYVKDVIKMRLASGDPDIITSFIIDHI